MGNWYTKMNSGRKLLYFEEENIRAELNNVAIGMLLNNNISCLVPCTVSQTDNKRTVSFNVTSYTTLAEYLEGEVTFDFVSDLFIDICSSVIELRKYMIETPNLILDTDKIYIDTTTHKVALLIDPLWNVSGAADCKTVFRNIIVMLKLDDNGSRRIGSIIAMINKSNFTVEGFLSDLKKGTPEISTAKKPAPSAPPVPERPSRDPAPVPTGNSNTSVNRVPLKKPEFELPPVMTESTPAPTDSSDKNTDKWWKKLLKKETETKATEKEDKKKNKGKASTLTGLAIPGEDAPVFPKADRQRTPPPAAAAPEHTDMDATVIEGDDDLTDVAGAFEYPRLIRAADNSSVSVDKDIFRIGRIGRDPSAKLELVLDQKLVSHHHATIKRVGDGYCIVDEYSTNHVYVNGKRIPLGTDFSLNDGDVIRIGPEEFTFTL